MAPEKNNMPNGLTGKFSFRDEFDKYLKYWPWFVFWIILAIAAGFFYLRYATPTYKASATIIINEEGGKSSGSELAAYEDLGFLNGMNSGNMDKEITILKSRRLMKDVVRALNINIRYFQEGRFRQVELYNDLPFTLKILKMDEVALKASGGGEFGVSSTRNGEFRITNTKTEKYFDVEAGKPFNLGFADVVIIPAGGKSTFPEVTVKIQDVDKIASSYRGKVQILPIKENSNVIEISLEDPVRDKAKDVIDQLIFEFNRDAIEDKNLIAGNTANFINDRLDIINNELESVETGKEEFKESNRLTDLGAESQMYIQNASEYNKKLQEVGTQMELAKAMLEYLSSASKSDLLPANLGIQEGIVNQQIGEYNDLVLERNRIMGSSTEKNPVVVRLSNRIDQIKSNIMQSLQRMRTNLQISQEDISRQASSIGSRILAVPSQEREYRGIERQQNIKEALYLFLLQKREENSLALAITAPKAKIVDKAYSSGGKVSPNSPSILLGSFLLGFFIPFSVVYLKEVMDNKVRSRKDIEDLTQDIPFVGELPKVKRKKDFLITKNDRSVVAESFRILISNLQYLLVNARDKKGAVIIFVTSTVKGEGKTFTSMNLALTLANTGHKVLIVGADLRNPKLQTYREDTSTNLGVSDYLVSNELCLKRLIGKSSIHPDLDVLTSGNIPPNPSELLSQGKITQMFSQLETDYDYLIVDTAPSMLVADTFFISKFADLTLYVVRAGYTEKKLVEFVNNAKKSGSIKNVGFVLNNVDKSNLGYGNKYGYGYGEDRKGFWGRR